MLGVVIINEYIEMPPFDIHNTKLNGLRSLAVHKNQTNLTAFRLLWKSGPIDRQTHTFSNIWIDTERFIGCDIYRSGIDHLPNFLYGSVLVMTNL